MELPDAVEEFPFGEQVAVYKVRGKLFALVPVAAKPPEFSVKCDPDEALALRDQYVAVRPGYHLNKRHWNTVTVDGSIHVNELHAFIEESWRLVVMSLPKAMRAELFDL
jgi:predicted DNA-binding protein (MmcQ/YjbR family)